MGKSVRLLGESTTDDESVLRAWTGTRRRRTEPSAQSGSSGGRVPSPESRPRESNRSWPRRSPSSLSRLKCARLDGDGGREGSSGKSEERLSEHFYVERVRENGDKEREEMRFQASGRDD